MKYHILFFYGLLELDNNVFLLFKDYQINFNKLNDASIFM